MPRVVEVIRRLFPDGTNPHRAGSPADWSIFPHWPPDAFAAAAVLAMMSGCYSLPRYAGGVPDGLFTTACLEAARAIGERWAAMPRLLELTEVQALWQQLYDERFGEVTDKIHAADTQKWWDAALRLLITADEAAVGAGFVSNLDTRVSKLIFAEHTKFLAGQPLVVLQHFPQSICRMIPPGEACVQPKTRTAQVGCTLRSLSHHLAILPPAGDVSTSWLFGTSAATVQEPTVRPLNLLLVPFPYQVRDGCVVPGAAPLAGENPAGFFRVWQQWLENAGVPVTAASLCSFLRALVEQAENNGHAVHGLVLPELALSEDLAQQVAPLLAAQTNLEVFVAGIGGPAGDGMALGKNGVFTCLFSNHLVFTHWKQSKHHRWKLDAGQTQLYKLNPGLALDREWWEQINIGNRHCAFWVFRPGATLATLVCEDLARVDPVQTAIRAVGPNLMIALLMDNTQVPNRWPGRYATVLGEDPGCSVLTFTSLGMMRRAGPRINRSGVRGWFVRTARSLFRYPTPPDEQVPCNIALWRDTSAGVKTLSLPAGSHALLVTLESRDETNYTHDGRSDNGCTVGIHLVGTHPITHPQPMPAWIDS